LLALGFVVTRMFLGRASISRHQVNPALVGGIVVLAVFYSGHSVLYLLDIVFSIFVFYYFIKTKRQLVCLARALVLLILVYAYLSLITSFALGFNNVYGAYFDLFSMGVGNSPFVSNLIAVAAVLTLFEIFGAVNARLIAFFLVFFLLGIAGVLFGSRLAVSVLTLVALCVVWRLNQSVLSLVFAVFLLVLLFCTFADHIRLFSEGFGSARWRPVEWLFSEAEFGALHLLQGREDLLNHFHLSAFHNSWLDIFFAYGKLGYFINAVIAVVYLAMFFKWVKMDCRLDATIVGLLLLVSILMSVTAVVVEADYRVMLLPLLFAGRLASISKKEGGLLKRDVRVQSVWR